MARLTPLNGYFGRHFGRDMWRLANSFKRRRPRGGGELQPEPVEPPRPKPLIGGAEAPLEFDS